MAKGRSATLYPAVTGRIGNLVVIANNDGAVIVREYVVPANPRTPSQQKARITLRGVPYLWGELTDEERAAWQAFARAQGRNGYHAFVGLATKWRTVNGNGMPPALPPTEAFFGDSVGLSVAAGPAGSGSIVVTAQRPNQPGVVVEIRLQRLRATHVGTKPKNWVTKAFVSFEAGSLTKTLDLFPGAYAIGYRYVNAETGQETEMAVLGKLFVSS
jgi:hypothetical protein